MSDFDYGFMSSFQEEQELTECESLKRTGDVFDMENTFWNQEEREPTEGELLKKTGDIFDMAKAFLNIESMTHKKLQKLCYYAKAWYLAIYNQNIIEEPFEAWIHGAVQPDLYQTYKIYGFGYIPRVTDTRFIPEEFLSFSREVYSSYGNLNGDELEKLNHSETPWLNARVGLKPWQSGNRVISEEDMKEYYRAMM